MCGIAAILAIQGSIQEKSLKRAVKSLYHRGPDGERYWFSSNKCVGLGHSRLSVIDLEGGTQPLSNEDERLHLVVNGEFYGYRQIQRDLKNWGYRLSTHSDSEIALHLYDKFGTQCLHYLRGEFAFILWDARNETLFAARDRFGIKPLYYTIHNGQLYLASEVKALFAAGVPSAWDYESFFHANCLLQVDQDRTLFQGIYQVPPGHFMIASRNQIKIVRYWDFDYPCINEQKSRYSENEYIEKLRFELDRAIQLRLQADVPVGFYLSGGLDSSVVLGMAAQHASETPHAFTLSFEHSDYDEVKIARETAAYVGAKLDVIPVTNKDFAEYFADAIYHGEMLCRNPHVVGKYLISKAAQNAGYKVVLTGEGSDEIFCGYPHSRRDILLYKTEYHDEKSVQNLLKELEISNTVSSGIIMPDDNFVKIDSVKKILGFVPSWMEIYAGGYSTSSTLYSSEFSSWVSQRDIHQNFLNGIDVKGQLANREPVYQSLYLWSKIILPNYVFRMLGDNMDMAHSIENRIPFLDHQLVEFVRDIPLELKIKGMTEKYILKEASKHILTNTVYQREKHPFVAPPSTLNMSGQMHELLQDTLRSDVMNSLPFYDQKAVISLLDRLPKIDSRKHASIDFVLMEILSACILQEKFGLSANIT